jgi:polyisoprenoid-binding protein YceI
MQRGWCLGIVLVVAASGCSKEATTAKKEAWEEMPAKSSPAAPPKGSMEMATPPPAAGHSRMTFSSGKGTFLIDAPLEKIKGRSEETDGVLDVDVNDLGKTRGELGFRMASLKTETFGDKDKDESQTEHARNWMEVGHDSSPEKRKQFEWAKFVIKSLEATPAKLAEVPEANGVRTLKVKATGEFTLHGVSSSKTVPVTVTFKGPADAPTEVMLKSDEALSISLKEHGVMPRDKVGSFLNGALERIGKKIDDKVQVMFEATAKKG